MNCWNVGYGLVSLTTAWCRWLYKCARTTGLHSLSSGTEGSESASRSPTVSGFEQKKLILQIATGVTDLWCCAVIPPCWKCCVGVVLYCCLMRLLPEIGIVCFEELEYKENLHSARMKE